MDMKQYQKENAEIQYKHRYWGFQIATYLFLGGLGGGILFLSWVLTTFVFPDTSLVQAFMLPNFIALLAIVLGLFFLVEELGQPPVFYRAYVTATSIIKWGAVLLTIASFGDLFWLLGNWSPEVPILGFLSVFNFLGGLSGLWLGAAGIAGFGIMVYTGVMLSTLKAHSFWSTPALPILFTTSALSTACAGIMLSLCGWPGVAAMSDLVAAHEVHELLHVLDIILGFAELTIHVDVIIEAIVDGRTNGQLDILILIKALECLRENVRCRMAERPATVLVLERQKSNGCILRERRHEIHRLAVELRGKDLLGKTIAHVLDEFRNGRPLCDLAHSAVFQFHLQHADSSFI